MQATFKSVNFEKVSKGKANWEKAVVTYEGDQGEKKQNLVSFKNPAVFAKLRELSEGDVIDVKLQKDGDFWQWAEITKLGANSASNARPLPTGGKAPTSNYETKEERAARQILIVRQNALTNAVTRAGVGADPQDIVNTAEFFASWVQAKDIFKEDNDLGDVPL
jgi:hypothetical protein